jgi:RND family efflux transporter MFP subunit
MRKPRLALASVVPLMIVALCFSACGKIGRRKTLPSAADKVYTVSAAKVQTRTIPDVIEIKGIFEPIQRVVLKSDFTGRVQALSVIEGQSILAGDAILKIDDEKLPFVLDRQRAELKEAESQLELDNRLASGGAPVEEEVEEPVVVEEEEGPEPPRPFRNLFPGISPEPEEPGAEAAPPPPEQILAPEDAGGFYPAARLNERGLTERGLAERAMEQALMSPEDAGGIAEGGPTVIRDRLREMRLAAVRRQQTRTPTRTGTSAPAENPEVTESRLTLDQAKIDRLKAEIALTERQLAGSTIASPIDGFVGKVPVTEGSLVKPDDVLVEILQVDPIELILKVSKDQIDKLDKSMEVKVTAPDLPGQSFKGEISFIGAELDQDRKSVEVRVRAANPNLKVKVGMDGVSEMGVANKTHEALLVPFEAVLRDGDSRFVYVLDGSVAEKREVVTGSFYEGMVEIRDGLKASDQVVTRGAESLKEDEEFVKVSS